MNVVITGVSSGLGEAMARAFVKKGYTVFGLARREERLKALKNELGNSFSYYALDITDHKKAENVIEEIEKLGPIDLLINNAALLLENKKVHEIEFSKWEIMMQTNVMALLHLTHLIVPKMKKRGAGQIINIGSIAAEMPSQNNPIYASTKAFVKHFSASLRLHLEGSGIKITNIEPGLAKTEYLLVKNGGDEKASEEFFNSRSHLDAEDIANVAIWVAEQPKHVDICLVDVRALSKKE